MADITISGQVVFNDNAPINNARIRIWENDTGNNPDDLIVDDRTDSNGRFSGSGDWKDSRTFVDIGIFRYQVDFDGRRKTGGNISNPHNFFSKVRTSWDNPAATVVPPPAARGNITIAGSLIYRDGVRVEGARVRIWESDSRSSDDLIVDAVTDASGAFRGSGRWKDDRRDTPGSFKYRVDHPDGMTKTGRNILNPRKFFQSLRMPWPSGHLWSNWLSDLDTEIPYPNYHQPTNRAELRTAIESGVAQGLKVKVVGSGHSHSEVAQPVDGNVLINMHELAGELNPYPWLRSRKNPPLEARMKAGTRIRELNRAILAPQGMGLPTMGPFDGQTISGAINTNTHGTGIAVGGFADMVASMEMFVVVPNANGAHEVQLWVIEPTNGISDPARFASRNNDARRFLKQDDNLFHATVCGYGLMGVALSYVLTVRDYYWLDEVHTKTTWGQIKDRIPEIANTPGARSGSPSNQTKLYVHIAKAIRSGGLLDATPCRQDEWTEQSVEARPSNWNGIWPPERPRGTIADVGQFVSGAAFDITGRPSGTNSGLLTSQFFTNKSRNFFDGGREKSAYYRAIRRLQDRELKVDPANANHAIDNTAPKGPPGTSDHALTSEIAVAVEDVAAALEAAVDALVNVDINFLTPVGIRFTAPSDHYLCPTAGRETAFIEISGWLPNSKKGQWPRYRSIYRTALRAMITAVRAAVPDARFHLGKFNIENADRFAIDYPNFDRWINLYAALNATGIWDCPNSERWELDDAAPNLSLTQARQLLRGI